MSRTVLYDLYFFVIFVLCLLVVVLNLLNASYDKHENKYKLLNLFKISSKFHGECEFHKWKYLSNSRTLKM